MTARRESGHPRFSLRALALHAGQATAVMGICAASLRHSEAEHQDGNKDQLPSLGRLRWLLINRGVVIDMGVDDWPTTAELLLPGSFPRTCFVSTPNM